MSDAQEIITHSAILGETFSEETLEHYGRLGMKWGVRNPESRRRVARLKDNGKRVKRRKIARKSTVRDKNTLSNKPKNRKPTDAELRKVADRLRLETEIRRLRGEDTSVDHRTIQKLLKDITYDAAKGAGTDVGKAALSYAMKKALEKKGIKL